MTFKELKDILNRLPTRLDNTNVTMVKLDENGSGKIFDLDEVVYGTDVSFWSEYKKEDKQ